MTCARCGKDAYLSTTAEVMETGYGLVVIKNIPCYKCTECDEIFYTGDVALKIEDIMNALASVSQEITVVDYSKAA